MGYYFFPLPHYMLGINNAVRILENMASWHLYTLTRFMTTYLEFGSAEQLLLQRVVAVVALLFI